MNSSRIKYYAILIPSILLIPFISMYFTDEVNWSPQDFLIAFILLVILFSLIEVILRMISNRFNRIILLVFLLISFLVLWAEMAVGLFSSPISGS